MPRHQAPNIYILSFSICFFFSLSPPSIYIFLLFLLVRKIYALTLLFSFSILYSFIVVGETYYKTVIGPVIRIDNFLYDLLTR